MCLLTSFSLSSVTSATRVPPRAPSTQHLHDLARLRRVRDRIDREYARPLDVEALARAAHMSAGHLSREFRLAYGESPYGYLMTRRIERAMALLRRGDLSSAIARSMRRRSEEHTSELQSRFDLVCRLLLEKKKK